jgi:putative molybdopterin biosynthesis protein
MSKPESSTLSDLIREASQQRQFLTVVSADEARVRFESALSLAPLGVEEVDLTQSLGRILAEDVVSAIDVPGFDRSSLDGFAVRSGDTIGATEERPVRLRLNPELLSPGIVPQITITRGTATAIATGGMLPRGADAVVMVEQTELVATAEGDYVDVQQVATPGQAWASAGSDIARGELALRKGTPITSREIGILAALGMPRVQVFRRPRVAVISTGDELIAPGETPRAGSVFDSNGAILVAAIRELGAEAEHLGIVGDDSEAMRSLVSRALDYDAVLLSGGTSKGAGDLSYRVVEQLVGAGGVLAHGIALKPGKPLCLAAYAGRPVVILPGFPTSAIFTFHEFVAPVLRRLGGNTRQAARHGVPATLAVPLRSELGRTEFVMVGLLRTDTGFVAYPSGSGSGSVTSFSQADGFVPIGADVEGLAAGAEVEVQIIGEGLEPADIVFIGSHCTGVDYLLGRLQEEGFAVKALHVGSMGGLAAARRGECDVAGMHLMDPQTRVYNRHLLNDELLCFPGYRRMQGIVHREGDPRFQQADEGAPLRAALADPDCLMVNRNPGSGTRVLIDELLEGTRPAGYGVQPRSHHAVAAAVARGRADWGVAIAGVAREYGLGFIPLQEEHYDFVVPRSREKRPAVRRMLALLGEGGVRRHLAALGLATDDAETPPGTSGPG